MKNPTLSNPVKSDTLLIEHFATLATAPDGIARLRELILQLAVQGKLGTQDAGDEPASVLLDKIKLEKKALVKEGKIKRENIIPTTQELESLYPLPKGWEWSTLNDVFLDIRSGGTPSKNNPQFWDGEIYWASVKDLKDKKYLESTQDRITQKGLDECRSKLIPPGNLIICVRMGLGKIAINNVPIAINQDLKAADLSKNVDINFFYNFYRAQTVKGTGMTVDGIRQEKLLQMPFPLPPLAEQHRIVAKVDRIMGLCDELEARQQQERASCLKLGTASLAGLQNAESREKFEAQWAQVCDAFDLILDCPENVAVLRHTILQLSVQGLLVRQEPGDEPADELLVRIRKEKADIDNSMMKNLNDYCLGKQPFSIPKNWAFVKLHQVCKNITDGDHQPPPKITHGVPFIVISNISNGKLDFNTTRFVTKEYFNQIPETRKPHLGDILYTVTGSYGIPVIVNVEKEFCFQRHIGLIKPSKNIDLRYMFWTLKSPLTFEQSQKSCTGIAQPTVSLGSLRNFVIPLPPLAEQHRIVAKVDALMALCDALESRLKERVGVQGRLAGAVVRGVVERPN